MRMRRPRLSVTHAATVNALLMSTGRRKRTKIRAVTVGKRCQVARRPQASSSAAPTTPPWTIPGAAWCPSANEKVAS